MPFTPSDNAVEVRLLAQLLGQQIENVWHVKTDASPDPTTIDAIADAVAGWVIDSYANELSNQVQFNEVLATDISVSGGYQASSSLAGQTGTNTSAVKSNNDTIAVTLRTDKAGRSYRGRTYVLGVPSNTYADPNHVITAYVDELVTCFDALITAVGSVTGAHLGILSKVFNKVPRDPFIVTPVVSARLFDNVIDSQRRRLPGRGR